MRVFIAIALEPEIKTYLEKITAVLKSYCKKGNFTKKENLHLTIQFLGEINPQELSAVEEAVFEAAYRQNIFSLKLQELGFFSQGTKKIAWVGLSLEKELNRIFTGLERALTKQGFPKEKRRFSPHITIAREIELLLAEQVVQKRLSLEKKEILVQGLTIFESVREGSSLVYRPLASAPFRQRRNMQEEEN